MSDAPQDAADWLGGVDEALATGSDVAAMPEGAVITFDQASNETAETIGEAMSVLQGLQFLSWIAPAECALFDSEMRRAFTILGKALEARGRFLTAHLLLTGLAPGFPN